MGRLQDFPTVTPTSSDNLLVVQSTGQGLASVGSTLGTKMDKTNPTGTGSLSIGRTGTTGSQSVAVGYNVEASGARAVALGYESTASGSVSHAEGRGTTASGSYSHSENINTVASGDRSHCEGYQTEATRRSQHVFGEYNIKDTSGADGTAKGAYIEIVGKGTNDANRSNARTLDWSGNEVLAGDCTIKGNVSLYDALGCFFNKTNLPATITLNLLVVAVTKKRARGFFSFPTPLIYNVSASNVNIVNIGTPDTVTPSRLTGGIDVIMDFTNDTYTTGSTYFASLKLTLSLP